MTPSEILSDLRSASETGFDLRQRAMNHLDSLPTYDWSGIYRLEGDSLLLDAYVGAATDHVKIAVGVGVCGTAVAEDKNQVIEDVQELDNYLACSLSTRSEIVVLIRDENGQILGQIDIDGHQVGAFKEEDEKFLSEMAELLAARWA